EKLEANLHSIFNPRNFLHFLSTFHLLNPRLKTHWRLLEDQSLDYIKRRSK
ncbi:hypothetical protein LINGRAHAP2_LOCUS29169, partial [Linum grandiflorum]